jgi:hypothetical protein
MLFAGALATVETHRRLQGLADAAIHAYPGRIEPHLVVPHELPEDRAGKGEILLDPRGELHHYYGARSACLSAVNLPMLMVAEMYERRADRAQERAVQHSDQ